MLKDRSFRLLLAGSSVSMLGTRISTVAFPMLALSLTDSPVAAGWMAFAATAPSMLFYIPAGALVDRWRPRRVMLISEFGQGLVIATVVVALLLGRASLTLLMEAAALEGILGVFSTLAEKRYVSSIVSSKKASFAQVRMEARTHLAVLAGRPLGSIMFALSPALPFIADLLSFIFALERFIKIRYEGFLDFIASLCARIINRLFPARARRQQGHAPADRRPLISAEILRDDISSGLKWINNDKFARISIVLSAWTTLICQALIIVLLTYAHDRHLSAFQLGIALAGSGLGGLFGSVIASQLPAPTRRAWALIRIFTWNFCCIALLFTREPSFPCMALTLGALAFTGALGNVEFGTYVAQNAPDSMLARVISVGRLMSLGASAIGPALGGIMIEYCKFRGTTWLLAVSILTLSFISLLLPSAQTGESRVRAIVEVARDLKTCTGTLKGWTAGAISTALETRQALIEEERWRSALQLAGPHVMEDAGYSPGPPVFELLIEIDARTARAVSVAISVKLTPQGPGSAPPGESDAGNPVPAE